MAIFIGLILSAFVMFLGYIFTISFVWDSSLRLSHDEDVKYKKSVENKAIGVALTVGVITLILTPILILYG